MMTIQNTLDSTPVVIVGRIVAVRGDRNADGFYTAESVTYDIDAHIPKQGVIRMDKQLPQTRLFVGSMELDSQRLVGCSIIGVLVLNKVRWEFIEPPALIACGAPLARYGISQAMLMASQGGNVGIVEPPATPTQPGTGTPTAPDMGEV
jgi:hypothetical protein